MRPLPLDKIHRGEPTDGLGNNGAYDPGFLQAAYNLTSVSSSRGGGSTVAIVDAYDDPNAEADLAQFRASFGLPTCSTANGCFSKVNQTGATGAYPQPDAGWAEEVSLDLDVVSGVCPNCHILLVEANSSSLTDLGAAENQAAKRHPAAISNSYGAAEFSGEQNLDRYYSHSELAVTASAGDNGYGVEYPAASSYVTAVGGTSLVQAAGTNRNATETVWAGTGGGCSSFVAKPSWQRDVLCPNRTVSDVSADADPGTGVWAFDTYQQPGWLIFGGTSVSAPLVASVYALAGNTSRVRNGETPYLQTGNLNDIVSGADGSCGDYLCQGSPGYDGPSGNGTPNGTGAF